MAAFSYPVFNSFTHIEPRSCVIKTSNIGSILDDVLRDRHNTEETLQERVDRLVRRILMEAYILNRFGDYDLSQLMSFPNFSAWSALFIKF